MRKVLRSLSFLITVILLALVAASPIYGQTGRGVQGLETAIAAQERHTGVLMANPDVVGTAVGLNAEGEPAVVIFTETRGRGLPSTLDGVPVVVRRTGKIYALHHRQGHGGGPAVGGGDEVIVDPTARFDRPVPIGISTGHPDITAGTIGCRVTDGTDVYALSNNHVYADENNASINDNVLQPGNFDGGVDPADKIGTLNALVEIKFDGSDNTIDAALAITTTGDVGNSTPSNGYGTPKSMTVSPTVGTRVKKYGRTTSETQGRISAINATVNVGYDSGVARFVGQIVIEPGSFSAGGDSGSCIVVDGKGRNKNDDRKVVGLLYAGSPFVTIANSIDDVLSEFGVTIDGE